MLGPEGDQGGALTLRHVEQWLTQRPSDKPFFLFVNLLEAHLPYDPPQAIRDSARPPLPGNESISIAWAHDYNAGVYADEQVEWDKVRGLYAADAHVVDGLFGSLLSLLEREGVLDDLIIVATSDHGENLGEHQLMEHQFSVHETVLSVPLLVRTSGGQLPAGRYPQPVMTTDLYATIADLGLADWPKASRLSVPLMRTVKARVDAKRQRALFADHGYPFPALITSMNKLNPARDVSSYNQALRTVRAGPMRMTVTSVGSVLLHDMSKEPMQASDVSARYPEVVAQLGELLKQVYPKNPIQHAAPHALDPATRKQLQGLGYVTGDDE